MVRFAMYFPSTKRMVYTLDHRLRGPQKVYGKPGEGKAFVYLGNLTQSMW